MSRYLVLALSLAACRDGAPHPTKPCKRGAAVEVRRVDNDSAYMKSVFARVGDNRDGRPTDPEAIKAEIRDEIDQWHTDEYNEQGLPVGRRPTETDYYLLGYDKKALEQYLAAGPPLPPDRMIGYERGHPGAGATDTRDYFRTYLLVKQPILDTSAIAQVEVSRDPGTADLAPTARLMFTLTNDGKRTFAEASTTYAGKKIAILIDGDISSAPILNGPITGGTFFDPVSSETEARVLADKLACVK